MMCADFSRVMSHHAEFSLGECHSTDMRICVYMDHCFSSHSSIHTSDIPDGHVYHFSWRREMTSLMDTGLYTYSCG